MSSFCPVRHRFNVASRSAAMYAACRRPSALLLIDVINASGYRPDPEVDQTGLSAHAHCEQRHVPGRWLAVT